MIHACGRTILAQEVLLMRRMCCFALCLSPEPCWFGVGCIEADRRGTHCEFIVLNLQVVVVLSGSMEPGFQRGDILFLNMGKAPIRTGEIVVFNIDGRDIPIVHRVIKVHERANEDHVDILTKVRAAGAPNRCSDGTQVCKHALWLEMLHCSLMLSDVGAACCCMLQGDNNYGDDRLLYARGQDWLHKHHIMGRAVG